ncbi:hypothetical protein B0H10DRAFT_1966127 [Mycena sp. CBHHK59/15]|nr:hypothetical protein B0H10DRAFT_1966127 [Mycena sp. CBHHK59/15]
MFDSSNRGVNQMIWLRRAVVGRYSRLESALALDILIPAQGAACAACDITITVFLSYILRRARTGMRRTDSVLDKMVIYAFNRGTVTSLLALIQLIFFVAMPTTFILSVTPSYVTY